MYWVFLSIGVVKFHECNINELEISARDDLEDMNSVKSLNVSTTSLLDHFVGNVRESLGVESHLPSIRYEDSLTLLYIYCLILTKITKLSQQIVWFIEL